jgi:hypothetical protein
MKITRNTVIPIKRSTAFILIVAIYTVLLNLSFGYFLFYVVDGLEDAVTIGIKLSIMAIVSFLYVRHMLSLRAPGKKFSRFQ